MRSIGSFSAPLYWVQQAQSTWGVRTMLNKPGIHVHPDITRTTLAILFIGILIAGTFWIVRPFLTSFIWATMIVVATWPVLLRIQARLWNRRGLAVAVMTLILLLVLIVPFLMALFTIIDKSDEIVGWAVSLSAFTLPPPPNMLEGIPIIGRKLVEHWHNFALIGPAELSSKLVPYSGKVIRWFVSQAGSAGMIFLHFMLTVIIAAILYKNGETAACGVLRFARRLAGHHGEETAILAARAVKGVALGVVITALIQSILSGMALSITGIPAAMLLTAVIFMLCISQVGPGIVLAPSVIWLFWRGETLWGAILLVCTLFIVTIDNFIRPFLIRKGADLPLILIFTGVIGGLISFGIIGLFIGPVVLAVTYTLLKAWVTGGEPENGTVSPGS